MVFRSEQEFEDALVAALSAKGWEPEFLNHPTQADLIDNWAKILFENNRSRDRLGDAPLTDTEMAQILEQIAALRTPLKLNGFINGKSVVIKRDNPADPEHLGKEVSLKIYDRREIAAGQSRYQIARQPHFGKHHNLASERRGDVMLLINGMPVIHVELKRSGVPVSQAAYQIEKYAHEGIFSGIFSLVQIFVAMNPEETLYFANPGPEGRFDSDFYFHWADFNNEPVNEWTRIVADLLAIPMAHQLIGFYTVADDTDGVLKVMRSYQYYAANRISDRVAKTRWGKEHQRGGYIWHTTGSGKTLTSFKSAQLIADSKDADKVIFLMDRIELGTQSLREYRGFADLDQDVQETSSSHALVSKLASSDPADTLIVTSIQKMSLVNGQNSATAAKVEKIQKKRLAFVVDEAHRSTFGDMLTSIKATFPRAIFFGFTGTPIQEENQKKHSTTSTIFGDELHRYSIADGIRDKNVLGFDARLEETFRTKDLREKVALEQARAESVAEVFADPARKEIFQKFMDKKQVPDAGRALPDGSYLKGIEDYVPKSQWETPAHREAVAESIAENWVRLSANGKFHAILATSSIYEAIEYYGVFKEKYPQLKVASLFDPSIDNNGGFAFKEDGLLRMLEDYNARYGTDFTIPTYAKYKKDLSARLAHKKPYERIAREPEKQVDLLIVVDQMLTGFDSKWLNTLYLDKLLSYELLIQAFSRTNRLFGPDKPFGNICYYRKPHTQARNIEDAVKLYSGDRPLGLFVEKLDKHLEEMNRVFSEISAVFTNAGVHDFAALPTDVPACAKFAKLYGYFNEMLAAARIQGFSWDKLSYKFKKPRRTIEMLCDERTYLILAQRYKELAKGGENSSSSPDVPYDIETHLTEIDTDRIDSEYMNTRFEKYLKALRAGDVQQEKLDEILGELYSSFAALSQEEQKYANIFIHDVQAGDVQPAPGRSLRDYITDYLHDHQSRQIDALVDAFGIDAAALRKLLDAGVNEANLNEYGRFDDLHDTVDREAAARYFTEKRGEKLPAFLINVRVDEILKDYILGGILPEDLEDD